ARLTQIDSFNSGIVLEYVGRWPVSFHPKILALIHIDRRNAPPWWFNQRQTQWPIWPSGGTPADIVHIGSIASLDHPQRKRIGHGAHIKDAGFRVDRSPLP